MRPATAAAETNATWKLKERSTRSRPIASCGRITDQVGRTGRPSPVFRHVTTRATRKQDAMITSPSTFA